MLVKQHYTQQKQLILAVCDDGLLGKKFVENGLQLDVSKEFYGGVSMNKKEIIRLFSAAHIIHFVGEEAVALGREQKLVDPHRILRIQNIPHTEVLFS